MTSHLEHPGKSCSSCPFQIIFAVELDEGIRTGIGRLEVALQRVPA
jgi:hypothetical protein